jgi:FkbM family methyltransferase
MSIDGERIKSHLDVVEIAPVVSSNLTVDETGSQPRCKMALVQLFRQLIASFAYRWSPSTWLKFLLISKNHNMESELWLVPRLLSEGDVAIDVGANIGIWSLQLARFTKHVHAFEPNPICLRQLARVLPPRVTVHRCALSDHVGTTALRFDPDNTGVGTIEQANQLQDNPGIKHVDLVEVEVTRLDTFDFVGVALIKIDVEGHEEAVLRGAQGIIRRDRPTIITEVEERHNPGGLRRIRALFRDMDYVGAALDDGGLRYLEQIEAHNRHKLADAGGINNFIFMDRARASRLFSIEEFQYPKHRQLTQQL